MKFDAFPEFGKETVNMRIVFLLYKNGCKVYGDETNTPIS